MSVHIVCVTSGSGIPIFNRKKGNVESLPFSAIGSLNGVHLFAKSQKMELLNTLMEDHCAVWKEFYDCLLLIGISSGCTMEVLNKLLESVFNAMLLIVGVEEIQSQRNCERLKRELRVCYPLIDRLMDSLDCGDTTNNHQSDIIMLAETILCTENHLIQIVLESYTECVESVYSCILIHGKIAVATESWWSLHPDEIKLLSLLASVENIKSSRDIAVFLPHRSPTIAYRFVVCTLIPGVLVCCLCGPTPTLEEIESSATQCFKSSLEIFEAATKCHPRNFPDTLHLESGILGILLLNTKAGKYMFSNNPSRTSKHTSGSSHRLDILRTFYYRTVLNLIVQNNEEVKKDEITGSNLKKLKSEYNICKESYWSSEYHKCHAIIVNDNILCMLYNSSIPMHTIRLISNKTLKTFTTDKQICW